jgi:hypothetical protein
LAYGSGVSSRQRRCASWSSQGSRPSVGKFWPLPSDLCPHGTRPVFILYTSQVAFLLCPCFVLDLVWLLHCLW